MTTVYISRYSSLYATNLWKYSAVVSVEDLFFFVLSSSPDIHLDKSEDVRTIVISRPYLQYPTRLFTKTTSSSPLLFRTVGPRTRSHPSAECGQTAGISFRSTMRVEPSEYMGKAKGHDLVCRVQEDRPTQSIVHLLLSTIRAQSSAYPRGWAITGRRSARWVTTLVHHGLQSDSRLRRIAAAWRSVALPPPAWLHSLGITLLCSDRLGRCLPLLPRYCEEIQGKPQNLSEFQGAARKAILSRRSSASLEWNQREIFSGS